MGGETKKDIYADNLPYGFRKTIIRLAIGTMTEEFIGIPAVRDAIARYHVPYQTVYGVVQQLLEDGKLSKLKPSGVATKAEENMYVVEDRESFKPKTSREERWLEDLLSPLPEPPPLPVEAPAAEPEGLKATEPPRAASKSQDSDKSSPVPAPVPLKADPAVKEQAPRIFRPEDMLTREEIGEVLTDYLIALRARTIDADQAIENLVNATARMSRLESEIRDQAAVIAGLNERVYGLNQDVRERDDQLRVDAKTIRRLNQHVTELTGKNHHMPKTNLVEDAVHPIGSLADVGQKLVVLRKALPVGPPGAPGTRPAGKP